MSTYDYSGISNKAVELLTKYGGTFQIQRIEGTKEIDPVSQSYIYRDADGNVVDEPTTVNYDIIGLLTNYTEEDIDGETIKRSDRKLLATASVEPCSTDIFLIGGRKYQYIYHDAIQPNMEDSIIYKIQVRI